ncbi:NAD(P)H-dependent oxidoreductase [Streptomyces rubiginosohelvolus]|uniref:NAD(P)H-dependent oxidoreductase n=1 Tax=Streptomyces TaxID=1883 RepID=UPI00099684B2|nr:MULTISPECIES: NAD(P)H-dependent oxidoreductase [Streptomyces]
MRRRHRGGPSRARAFVKSRAQGHHCVAPPRPEVLPASICVRDRTDRPRWLTAHPEPRSLSGSLFRGGVRLLREQGHEVRTSDLYAMNFNPVVTADDFAHPADERLIVGRAGQEAVRRRTLAPDITAEHDKLTWADTLIVQFPLWWTAKTGGSTSMPAYHRVPCCRGTGVRSARR